MHGGDRLGQRRLQGLHGGSQLRRLPGGSQTTGAQAGALGKGVVGLQQEWPGIAHAACRLPLHQ